MHSSEAEHMAQCSSCSAEVAVAERVYLFGEDEVLCFACSEHRGGVYDELRDRWDVAPRVEDLLSSTVG